MKEWKTWQLFDQENGRKAFQFIKRNYMIKLMKIQKQKNDSISKECFMEIKTKPRCWTKFAHRCEGEQKTNTGTKLGPAIRKWKHNSKNFTVFPHKCWNTVQWFRARELEVKLEIIDETISSFWTIERDDTYQWSYKSTTEPKVKVS